MKRLHQIIKLLFTNNPEKSNFENKVFSIVSFSGAITCFLSLITNLYIDDYFLLDLLIGLTGVIFTFFFYLSFFKGITQILIVPSLILITLILTISWYFLQGIEGSIPLFFFPTTFLLIFSCYKKKYWIISISSIILAIVLVGVDYIYPGWTISYTDKKDQLLDLSFGFVISLVVLGVAAIILKKRFDAERLKVIQKNEELSVSESRLKRAELTSNSGNWELHVDTQAIIASDGAKKIYGFKDNQYDYKTIKNIPLPEYRELLDNALQNLLINNIPYSIEFKIKTKDTGEIKDIYSIAVYDQEKKTVFGIIQEITERKQAEESLRISEERFRSFVENANDIVYSLDFDGIFTYVSPQWKELLGHDIENVIGQNFGSFVHPDDLLKLNGVVRETIIKGEKTEGIEYRVKHKNGQWMWHMSNVSAIRDSKGKITILMGIARDVTENKQAASALKESEKKFRSLFSQMTEGFALHKIIYNGNNKAIDYLIIDVNPAYEKYIDIPAEKAKGAIASQLYNMHKAPFLETFTHVAETGEHHSFQFYFPTLNRFFEISAFSPLKGYFAIIFTDITDRKTAEKTIKDSQSKLSNAITIARLGPWEYDIRKNKFTFDDSFYSLFHTSKKEIGSYALTAQEYATHFIPANEIEIVAAEVKKAIETSDPDFAREFEHRIKYSNGGIGHIKVRYYIEKDNYGRTIKLYGINQDITEQIQYEETLKRNENRLRESNAAKDKFFSIIAHDLKNPFNGILGLSNMLLQQIKENDIEGIAEYAEIIQTSSQNAMNLLLNLLEWSRSQTGKMDFFPQNIDIVKVVIDAITLLIHTAQQKNISIEKDLPESMIITADKAMIGTILRNLISNAIKFTNTRGKIVVAVKQKQDDIIVSVNDNGIGMTKETIKKLFRIDENHSTPGTLEETGTGLGLILCKEFVEQHKGEIWVESEPEKGSVFSFSIPHKQMM